MIRAFFLLAALVFAAPASAQTYPPLTGRVVDAANLLDDAQEAALNHKLEALQRVAGRQLVVATIASLEGRTIEEYGVGLGRAWQIGQQTANNGVVLIVALAERKVRIEVGYGLEGILTDALTGRIIREKITPRFREGDYPGGINAGADAIIEQLRAPPEAAEQRVAAAAQAEKASHPGRRGGGSVFGFLVGGVVLLLFVILPLIGFGLRGRRYRGPWGRRGRVATWGRGSRGGDSGLGWMLAGMFLSNLGGRGRGGGWGGGGSSWGGGGGGGSSWGGGGGGFSGGGGSFGGGGASGGW